MPNASVKVSWTVSPTLTPSSFSGCMTLMVRVLRFDAWQNAIAFPGAWLRHPLAGDDAELQRLIATKIGWLATRLGDESPDQIRSVLRAALMTGHAGADEVAALIAIHSRTLNRRLGGFGTSFRKLVDEGRFAIARELLEYTALDVGGIAGALGYADASAFTRAFRRWSGTTPAAWRAHRSEGHGKPAKDIRRSRPSSG